MPLTSNLSLPLLAAAQAQKHVTHNEALMALDALAQLSVRSRALALPQNEQDGARYIRAAGAPEAGQVAELRDGAWVHHLPRVGWRAWVEDEGLLVVFDGTSWAPQTANANPTPRVGVNAVADDYNRLSTRASGVLFSHDDVATGGGATRVAINKSDAAKTGSLLFQSGYSGRAELACESGDALAFKVSADGAAWRYALGFDALGRVAVGGQSPASQLDVRCGSAIDGLQLSAPVTAATASCWDNGATPMLDINLRSPDLAATGGVVSFFRLSPSAGQTNLRLYRSNGAPAVNTLLGGNSMTYLAAATGNVGVGTSAPHSKLTVNGVLAPFADNSFPLGTSTYRWSAIYASTGVVNASDARLKRDVADCPLGLDFVLSLRPRAYRWIEGGADVEQVAARDAADPAGDLTMVSQVRSRGGRRLHLGLIAQDVKSALDEAGVDCGLWVAAAPADRDSLQSLRYDQLIAPLIAATQELARRVEALERRARA